MNKSLVLAAVVAALALAACSPQAPTAAPGSSQAPVASAPNKASGTTISIAGAGATAPAAV